MAIDTSKFAIQQVFTVDAFDLVTGAMKARLEDLKNSTLSNNGTIVYAQGGPGNAKIIGFSHSKESTLEIQNAVITGGALGIQTGSGLIDITASKAIPFDEVLTATSATAAATTYTATGTVGSEIGFAYILNEDGSIKKTLTQVTASASTGKFTYATGGKALTFAAGDVTIGEKILVVYYPTVASAYQINNATDIFAGTVRLHCKSLFRDTCTGKDYVGVLVIYKAKCGEEWGLDLSADGEPAVHNMTFEALKSCATPTLWDIFIYDTVDLT